MHVWLGRDAQALMLARFTEATILKTPENTRAKLAKGRLRGSANPLRLQEKALPFVPSYRSVIPTDSSQQAGIAVVRGIDGLEL